MRSASAFISYGRDRSSGPSSRGHTKFPTSLPHTSVALQIQLASSRGSHDKACHSSWPRVPATTDACSFRCQGSTLMACVQGLSFAGISKC